MINDIPTIERIKEKFKKVTVIPSYIHSNVTEKKIRELQQQRAEFAESSLLDQDLDVVRRIENIVQAHNQFVSRPQFYRHVILNTGSLSDLYNQLSRIITDEDSDLSKLATESRKQKGPHLFIIDGASGSGRKSLISHLVDSRLDTLNVLKYTTRDKKDKTCRDYQDRQPHSLRPASTHYA